jgi:hypothetical protein
MSFDFVDTVDSSESGKESAGFVAPPVVVAEPPEVSTTTRVPFAAPPRISTTASIPVAQTPSISFAPVAGPNKPKRGGVHSLYGVFIGGAKLDDNYRSVIFKGASLYQTSTQCRNAKTLPKIEENLLSARDSITTIKFNGRLDAPEGNLAEIGKDRFIQVLKRKAFEHGQHTFYFVRDPETNKVVNLFEHSRRFKLSIVIAEHLCRSKEGTDFELYDQIERDECGISRTLVESLLPKPSMKNSWSVTVILRSSNLYLVHASSSWLSKHAMLLSPTMLKVPNRSWTLCLLTRTPAKTSLTSRPMLRSWSRSCKVTTRCPSTRDPTS